jgi:hypothetical protein
LPAPERYQPFVLRLATALVVAIVLLHMNGRVRGIFGSQPPSKFDQALRPTPSAAKIDARFVTLRDELQNSRTDRRYFEHILWPGLIELAKRRGITTAIKLPPPRWVLRRGPTLKTIYDLVSEIENKP